VEVASRIVVVGELEVDVVVRRNEEEAHLAPVDPPKGHALISRLLNPPTVMPLNHLGMYPRNFLFIITLNNIFS